MPMEWPEIPAAGPPTTTDPDNFDVRADDWVEYQEDLGEALIENSPIIESAYDTAVLANATANAAILMVLNGALLLGGSTTPMTLATGAKSPVLVQSNLAFHDGDEVVFIARVNGNARLYGVMADFRNPPSVTDFSVTSVAGTGGPYSDWYVIPKAFEPFIPPDNPNPVEAILIPVWSEAYALEAGTNKVSFRIPYAFELTGGVRASLSTAQASGSVVTVDINVNGSTILSTKLTIDNTEKTSVTATAPAVISNISIPDDAEITIDIDQVGSSTVAKGLKVALIGQKPT